ncbi:broad-minded protein-domain-containing protein [Chytriomyces sp. MP71]|nr:broad-minded protein-domain-containing protein [Chytriomyces sp. MP71]
MYPLTSPSPQPQPAQPMGAQKAKNDNISAEDIAQFLQSAPGNSNSLVCEGHSQGQNMGAKVGHATTIDSLLAIEKSDENFHKHGLVRHLRKQIDSAVGHLLDESALVNNAHQSERASIPPVVDSLMASSEYSQLLSNVVEQVRFGVAELTTDTPKNRQPGGATALTTRMTSNMLPRTVFNHSNSINFSENCHNSFSFSTHSNVTNDSSSGSLSTSFMSPPMEEVKLIISNLQSKNSNDIRFNAAQRFNFLSVADLLSSEFWAETKCGIETALADNDVRISIIGLRVCSKVFKASPPPMTGEVFLILAQHLIIIFEAGNVPKLENPVIPTDPRFDLLLRKFRLLLQFKQELPSCWLRFPDQLFCNVMNATFRLLKRPKSRGAPHVTVFHILSLIDPSVQWFEKWTLSCVGRAQSIASMVKADLISELVLMFLEYLSSIPCSGERFPTSNLTEGLNAGVDEVLVLDVEASDEHDKDGDEPVTDGINVWDLQYGQFCHLLGVLAKLIRSNVGRNQCFPVVVDVTGWRWKELEVFNILGKPKDKVILTVETFTVLLVKLLGSCPRVGLSRLDFDSSATTDSQFSQFHLSSIACLLLKDLLSVPDIQDVVTDSLFSELIEPLSTVLSISSEGSLRLNERTLLNVLCLLSTIASTPGSRQLIQDKTGTYTSSNQLSVVVEIVQGCLSGHIRSSKTMTLRVLGSLIFFLRQIYRTCEGIQVLQSYNLHSTLATLRGNVAWLRSWNDGTMLKKEWDDLMIDNLLNFASTPKGVLLLVQEGVIDECADHMFRRYKKKMQVSSCEKFGYGVLMSQISISSPGMKALCKTGLISSLIENVVGLLKNDSQLDEPDIDIDDHYSRKNVSSLLKAVSSFHGLATILEQEEFLCKKCNTLDRLIRELVLLERSKSGELLTAFEEGHQVGLRILSMLTNSLDSCLLLQQNYRFQEFLLKQQGNFRISNEGEFILDANSLIRNKILVTSYLCGVEKRLPGPDVDNFGLEFPLFDSFPCPESYLGVRTVLSIDAENKDVLKLRELLANAKDQDGTIALRGIQKAMVAVCKTMSLLPIRVAAQTMQKIISLAVSNWNSVNMNWKLIENVPDELEALPKHIDGSVVTLVIHYLSFLIEFFQVSYAVELGAVLSVRYAQRLIPSVHAPTAKRDLHELIKRIEYLLNPTRESAKGGMKSSVQKTPVSTQFAGFDWFAATIFIIHECSLEKSFAFLRQFKPFQGSLLLWPARALPATQLPHIYSHSGYFVELILEEEFPHVFNAFTLSGCTPSQVSTRWLRECFWNVLPFPEIVLYVTTALVSGIDYQLYYCIAILRHLERRILLASTRGELLQFLSGDDWETFSSSMHGFRGADAIDYMRGLEGKFRKLVERDSDGLGIV